MKKKADWQARTMSSRRVTGPDGFLLHLWESAQNNQSFQKPTPCSWFVNGPCGHLVGAIRNRGPHGAYQWHGYGLQLVTHGHSEPITGGFKYRNDAIKATVAALKKKHPPGGCPKCNGQAASSTNVTQPRMQI